MNNVTNENFPVRIQHDMSRFIDTISLERWRGVLMTHVLSSRINKQLEKMKESEKKIEELTKKLAEKDKEIEKLSRKRKREELSYNFKQEKKRKIEEMKIASLIN